jgi:8-oxo-dGTP pyrophosphatase MutT (NUDIX family)
MEKNKPTFKNRPNEHVMLYHNDFQGNKTRLDYWISRAPAVVGIVFAFGVEGGSRVLVIKRSNEMRDEPNKYGAPSGYLDWDESGFDGMIREVYEETSLYLPDYDPFLIYNNHEQPFYVHTDPLTDKNQNVSLTYLMVYDFHKEPDFFPKEIENYTDKETAKVEWLKLQDFYNTQYEWAFNHNNRIEMAMRYYKKVGERT